MSLWGRKTSTRPSSKVATSPPNGLNLVSNPAEANIDIIAVHGLNPLSKPSHALSTWTADGKLWLRDFLPERTPNARIFLYGYNSTVAFGTSTAGVREQAEALLDQIAKRREHCKDRPIIFIAHSLGGIVVKRALVHAKSDKSYDDIFRSTFGLVFFSTPHRGGNHAGAGDSIARLVRALAGNPENTYMKALKGESIFSEILADDFRQLLEQFRVLSFYETRPLGSFGIVVDKGSATLGLPGTREKQIPMDTDHRQICKFSSDEDPRYQQVADSIVELMNDAVTAHETAMNTLLSEQSGNTSRTKGSKNSTSQAGKENRSNAVGNGNKISQFGRSNSSEVHGEDNVTVQIEIGELEALQFAKMYLSNQVHSGTVTW
ncbi:hypothetical protein BKA66DRAFT_567421 [Pyrenochaeta sp. MPI-SDFR-AT-0127]|nr:hypothetical protein BKA66DRAFT_567421 [Pyrenochaeta sp. MPI-SDFR-AT-0127]